MHSGPGTTAASARGAIDIAAGLALQPGVQSLESGGSRAEPVARLAEEPTGELVQLGFPGQLCQVLNTAIACGMQSLTLAVLAEPPQARRPGPAGCERACVRHHRAVPLRLRPVRAPALD